MVKVQRLDCPKEMAIIDVNKRFSPNVGIAQRGIDNPKVNNTFFQVV